MVKLFIISPSPAWLFFLTPDSGCPSQRSRMRLLIRFLHLLKRRMRIYLRSFQARVPQQRLYGSYVRPIIEHRRRERMSQHVR